MIKFELTLTVHNNDKIQSINHLKSDDLHQLTLQYMMLILTIQREFFELKIQESKIIDMDIPF